MPTFLASSSSLAFSSSARSLKGLVNTVAPVMTMSCSGRSSESVGTWPRGGGGEWGTGGGEGVLGRGGRALREGEGRGARQGLRGTASWERRRAGGRPKTAAVRARCGRARRPPPAGSAAAHLLHERQHVHAAHDAAKYAVLVVEVRR
jgi:hypothetical protein